MKNKLILLLIASLLVWSDTRAQYFSKRYPLTLAGYISSIQIVNDTIYAMCQVVDTMPPYKNIGDFVKFDRNGNILSQSFFDIPSKTQIGANSNTLIRTSDGGFAYGGYAQDTTAFQSIILIKYDSYGRFQWYKELQDTNFLDYTSLVMIQDSFSNYYFTGYIVTKQVFRLFIHLTKTDSMGNLIYIKALGDSSQEFSNANGLCVNNKGHIVVGGGTGYTNTNDYRTSVTYLLAYELDSSGNILHEVRNLNSNGPGASCIYPEKNGNYIIANDYICFRDINTMHGHAAIALLDSNFNIVWQIDTGPCSLATGFLAVAPTADGNFIAVGQSKDLNDTIYGHQNGWIIKFKENGAIIWDKLYRGFSDTIHMGDVNLLASLGFLSNGDLIASGQASDNANVSYATQGWLLRLDTSGCLPDSANCGQVPSGIEDVAASSWTAVKLFPNPADETITMEYQPSEADETANVSVINQIGQQVFSGLLTGGSGYKTIDTKSWPTGLYYYRVMSDKGFESSGAFVINH